MSKAQILVIEDDEEMLENYSRLLKKIGYDCITEKDSIKALERLKKIQPDIIFTDLKMPGKDGFDVLAASRDINPDIPVVLITAYADIPTAVEAVKRGAFDFISKPFRQTSCNSDEKAKQKSCLMKQGDCGAVKAVSMDEIVGKSPAMQEVIEMISRVSDRRKYPYYRRKRDREGACARPFIQSLRHLKSFIPVDCAALPKTFLSELFGMKRAHLQEQIQASGLFEAPRRHLFLDEIERYRCQCR